MKEQKIIIEKYPWETHVAIVENGRLCELFWADEKEQVGNIYKGRIKDVLPGMSCAFVDIGMSRNAFLYWGDIMPADLAPRGFGAERLKRDQEVWVQIKKEAFGEKGAGVTEFISLPGTLAVLLPYQKDIAISRKITDSHEREKLKQIAEKILPANMGVILRTSCMQALTEDIEAELHHLLERWRAIETLAEKAKTPSLLYEDAIVIERVLRNYLPRKTTAIIVNDEQLRERLKNFLNKNSINFNADKVKFETGDLFEKYNLKRDLRKGLKRKIWLKSGGYLIFDVTEALTVIDVNSGRFSGSENSEANFLKINQEAALEIAYQLRLRSIGGMILVDFIDMELPESEVAVIAAMQAALQNDKAHTQVLGMTGLGLLEMTRKRSRYGLLSRWTEGCSRCHGGGRILKPEAFISEVKKALTVSDYLQGNTLVCSLSPKYYDLFSKDLEFNKYIKDKLQKDLEYRIDESLSEYQFNIVSQD